MVRDARGNELKEGDIVSLEAPSSRVVGDIQTVRDGGIVAVGGSRHGKDHVTPGEIIILVAFRLIVDPQNPTLGNVLKLHREATEAPKGGELVELPN